MKEEKIMSFETWFDQYKPILNPLAGKKEEFEEDDYQIHWGTIEENDFLNENKGENKIWTVVEGDKDSLYLVTGYKRVNRMYHFVTEIPYEKELEIELWEGYPEMTQKEIDNLQIIKKYMMSRDNPEYVETLEKVIKYIERTSF